MNSLLKKPSAWLPVVASLTLLAAMLIGIEMFGVPVREADEGTGAHLFQIWLALEVLMVVFFAVKWLPQRHMQALLVLTIQIVAALLPMSIVFFLKL